jgi:hypothetical protein
MALVVSNFKRKGDGIGLVAAGGITASGNYATNGDALDFAKVIGFTNRRPDVVIIVGKAGFIYQYDHVNLKVLVRTNTAGGVDNAMGELSAGAYPGAITGDDIHFIAYWIPVPGLPAV